MKYMITWTIRPDCHQRAAERFLAGGAPAAEGMEILGRWHAPGSVAGWVLAEGDVAAVSEHVAEWAGLLELRTTPVLDDAQAAAGMSKVYGAKD